MVEFKHYVYSEREWQKCPLIILTFAEKLQSYNFEEGLQKVSCKKCLCSVQITERTSWEVQFEPRALVVSSNFSVYFYS